MQSDSANRTPAIVLLLLAGLIPGCSGSGPAAPDDGDRQRPLLRRQDSLLGPARSQILLLGTFDLARSIASDESSRHGLTQIVERLIEFQPTKVAVGVASAQQSELDQRYTDYLKGRLKPERTALDRLALPVAMELGHARVWAIDAMVPEERPTDLHAYADEHGQTDRLQCRMIERYDLWFERERKFQATESIQENLVWLNDPERIAQAHGRLLVGEFDLGAGDEYTGADALLPWYNRHLRIFTHLQRLLENEEERILVVIDARHVPLLRHSVEASPRFDLIEVDALLGVPQGVQRQIVPLL